MLENANIMETLKEALKNKRKAPEDTSVCMA